jgi:KDO2-lipid IV(A) lauroyltransferase
MWCVPLRFALWIGRRIGDIAYIINLKRRSIAYANLKAAFPEKDGLQLKRINRAHFENLGMSMIELSKLPIMGKRYLDGHVKLEGLENVRSALNKGRGVVLLTAHFGNWEISSLAAGVKGYPMSVFAREQKYKRLNALLNELRQSTGCRVITKGFSAKDIIKTLDNNGIVGMLSDQDAGANGVFVIFFNRPASMAQGPVVFGLKTDAVILPSFIWRIKNDRHVARVGEPLELVNTGDKEKDMKLNLQRIADIAAGYIAIFPEQWLWSHKRWKSTPQRNVMVLIDRKTGHLNQAIAVAEMIEEALDSRLKARGIEESPLVKIQVVEMRFKNKFTKMLLDMAGIFAGKRCQGCLRCLRFCLTKECFNEIRNRYADIVISCGASARAPNIFLKYENNAKNIMIMKPGIGQLKKIDLVILPRHDAHFRFRHNVLVTEGAPNRITDRTMREAVLQVTGLQSDKVTGNGIGLLIGGDAKGFRLDRGMVEKVIDGILKISEQNGLDIFVTTSRRTPPEIETLLKERFGQNRLCKLFIIANEKNIEGAVPAIFGLSSIIVTSPESISMISEAASSGKQVIVYMGHKDTRTQGHKTKYERFVEYLEKEGHIKTADPIGVYDILKQIMETRPEIKRLDDRGKIIERLRNIV